jgi:hypothetical protein
MSTSREELRDHLVAAIEAAPELPRDGREYLADVFLDELDARFQLVPRSKPGDSRADRPAPAAAFLSSTRLWWPAIAAGFLFLVLLPSVVWLVAGLAGGGRIHHSFGFLPLLMLFVLVRFLGPWRHRRGLHVRP